MLREPVRVIRRRPTPRDGTLPDRFNIILELEASIPADSYLATASATTILNIGEVRLKAVNIAESYLKGEIREEELIERVREILAYERLRGEFPRYVDGTYFIPGSSLKGAIRSRIEHLLKPFEMGGRLHSFSCYIIQDPSPAVQPSKGHEAMWGKDATYVRDQCRGAAACYVCDLFGNPNLGSRVYFSDAAMTEGDVVRLEDLEVEAAVPGSRFTLSISGVNMSYLDLGLLLLGLGIIHGKPILLGMYKYRFQPSIGNTKYKGRYVLGPLKFKLIGFEEHLTKMLGGIGVSQLTAKARDTLVKSGLWSSIGQPGV